MKIQENRAAPILPPAESYTLTVSPEEMRVLRYFAATTRNNSSAAERFLRLTDNLVDVSTVPFAPEKCFLEVK